MKKILPQILFFMIASCTSTPTPAFNESAWMATVEAIETQNACEEDAMHGVPDEYSRCIPTARPTPTDSCLLWSQVTAQMEGRTVCIYGTVTSHTEDYTNELSRFYFGTNDQFFLVSNYQWDSPFEGECITTTGKILLNTYQVPYIKIDDRIDFCPSSFIIQPS